MKQKKPKPLTPSQKKAALIELYGAIMAGLLFSVKHRADVPEDIRIQAKAIQEKWDKVSSYRPLNPITIIELEKEYLS